MYTNSEKYLWKSPGPRYIGVMTGLPFGVHEKLVKNFSETFSQNTTGEDCTGKVRCRLSGIHEKPCQEFFGESFVERSWAVLYWQIEVPPFWYSWKTCETFFGRTFMSRNWPSLLGERSLDHAEGQGAWQWLSTQDRDLRWWQGRMREEWIASVVIRWKSEEKDLRHCRQHCIEQYGTNFVTDELPRLLRDFDGFPEDEITELTQDGPDLVPPNPILRLAHRCEKEFWIYSDESNDDIEADEEDGWETADEG